MAAVLLIVGAALVVAGAFLVSVPAGMVVAGAFLLFAAADLGRDREGGDR